MKLCCFFNYAPHYREAIYRLIDQEYDTQFYFGREVIEGINSGIKKLDYSMFKKKPIDVKNKVITLFGRKYEWRTRWWEIPFKGYDAVILTAGTLSGLPLMLLCKLTGTKVYAWGHGIKTPNSKKGSFKDIEMHLLHGYFVYGPKAKENMVRLGYDSDKIHVIYNSLNEGVNPALQLSNDNSPYQEHFGNDGKTVLFIGRLTSVKKLDWIIEAVTQLHSQGREINVVLIGDGPERDALERKANELGIAKNIWFYGACYDSDKLNSMIASADLCCSPGDVGLTALHSMIYGTPVISQNDFYTQMPEYETIIEGKTGMLYECGDFHSFCQVIELWLFSNPLSRNEIRQNCYDVINGKWNARYQISVFKSILKSK